MHIDGRTKLAAKKLRNHLALSVATLALTTPLAYAQSIDSNPPPEVSTVDKNGVDLSLGKLVVQTPRISLGSDQFEVSYGRIFRDHFRDERDIKLTINGIYTNVSVGGKTYSFQNSGTVYTPVFKNGHSLTYGNDRFTFTTRDGARALFIPVIGLGNGREYIIDQWIEPSGLVSKHYWTSSTNQWGRYWRKERISISSGYTIHYLYNSNGSFDNNWLAMREVFISNDRNYVSSPTFSHSNSGGVLTYNISNGTSASYRFENGKLVGITNPGSASEDSTITYNGDRVAQITNQNGTTAYSYTHSNNQIHVTVTDSLSNFSVYSFDFPKNNLRSVRNANNETWYWEYDTGQRVIRHVKPEGDEVRYSYDQRGNVTSVRQIAKSNLATSQQDIFVSSGYDAVCGNPNQCNKPRWTVDAGGQKDYSYHPSTGQLSSVTVVAP